MKFSWLKVCLDKAVGGITMLVDTAVLISFPLTKGCLFYFCYKLQKIQCLESPV